MLPKIKLIKNRSDIGAGTRGSDLGIDALEIAAINQKSDYFLKYDFEDLATHNESIYQKDKNSFAKRISYVLEHCTRLCLSVKNSLENFNCPVILSGDHSSALGTISGIKSAYPDKILGVVWIDAHADIHSPFTSPSGNIHGMPLAAAIYEDNMEYQINDVTPNTVKDWDLMKNIGIKGQKILPEHIVYFGVRDTEMAEEKLIEKFNIKNYQVDKVRTVGIETCVFEALERLQKCDLIYISFDVDSMDCNLISNGTGTPVANGFDQHEVIEIINKIIDSKKVVSIEFSEINPLLDTKGNKMAETAFEILENISRKLEKNLLLSN